MFKATEKQILDGKAIEWLNQWISTMCRVFLQGVPPFFPHFREK
jgi:hypothetical protein